MNNNNLIKANKMKNDEFYTLYQDIEKEIHLYANAFNNKIIYCNCDNPYTSNFVKYFIDNFKTLKLKGLICSSYSPNGNGLIGRYNELTADIEISELHGNGDFKSEECLTLLDESDIVVTNPPFSMFRDFLHMLNKKEKEFIILGNQNAITYKETINLFMQKKLTLGYNYGSMSFEVPENWEYGNTYYNENKKYARFGNICWFTNLHKTIRNKKLSLTQKFKDNKYDEYVNYDAIEINKISNIPSDYKGKMGVPITFMNVYDPGVFSIIGFSSELAIPMKEIAQNGEYKKGGPRFYIKDNVGPFKYKRLYDRVVIQFNH